MQARIINPNSIQETDLTLVQRFFNFHYDNYFNANFAYSFNNISITFTNKVYTHNDRKQYRLFLEKQSDGQELKPGFYKINYLTRSKINFIWINEPLIVIDPSLAYRFNTIKEIIPSIGKIYPTFKVGEKIPNTNLILSKELMPFYAEKHQDSPSAILVLGRQFGEGKFGFLNAVEYIANYSSKEFDLIEDGKRIVKTIYAKNKSSSTYYLSEYHALRKAGHLNPQEPYTYQEKDKTYTIKIVMDKAPGITLLRYLNLRSKDEIAFDEAIQICQAIANAYLKQVSNRGLVHCDLKPANIMIDINNDNPIVNIIDYGFAINKDEEYLPRGTVHYMPSEAFGEERIDHATEKLDIVSLGIVLALILGIGKKFFTDKNVEDIKAFLRRKEDQDTDFELGYGILLFENSKGASERNQFIIKKFLLNMISCRPMQRPSSQELVDFLAEIKQSLEINRDSHYQFTSEPSCSKKDKGKDKEVDEAEFTEIQTDPSLTHEEAWIQNLKNQIKQCKPSKLGGKIAIIDDQEYKVSNTGFNMLMHINNYKNPKHPNYNNFNKLVDNCKACAKEACNKRNTLLNHSLFALHLRNHRKAAFYRQITAENVPEHLVSPNKKDKIG